MPVFSIVIPTWNAEATIAETLRSVTAQTFSDFEVVVVDDGSTDGTRDVVIAYASGDSRVRLVKLANGGPSRARNIGVFDYAAGRFIAFLDADDVWAPEKLMRSHEVLSGSGAPDVVYGRIAFFRGRPEAAKTTSTVRKAALTPIDLLCENPVCTSSNIVVRADRFHQSGGFDPDLRHAEDVDWLIRLAAEGGRIEAIDETLVFYRASDVGLSADLDRMRSGWRANLASALAHGAVISRRQRNAAEAIHLRYLARRALRIHTPRFTSLRLAFAGLFKSPAGFLSDPRRGGMTLAAACAEPFLPTALRRAAFTR